MEDMILKKEDIMKKCRCSKWTAYKIMEKVNELAYSEGFKQRIRGTTSLYWFNKYMCLKNEIIKK